MSHFALIVICKSDDDLDEIMAPFNEQDEKYCVEVKDEDDSYTYTHNPNGQWDWWTIGGRWSGFFLDVDGNRVNEHFASELDFVTPRLEAIKAAEHEYDLMMEGLAGETFKPWPEIYKEHNSARGDAKAAYNSQPALNALRDFDKVRNLLEPVEIAFKDYDRFVTETREEYIHTCSLNVLTPFAVLKDGNWLEKGNMGMFGMASDLEDDVIWGERVKDILDNLEDDDYVYLVDCHV